MKTSVARFLGLVVLLCMSGSCAMAIGHRQIAGHVQSALPFVFPTRYISVPSFIDVYTVDGEFLTRTTSDSDGYFTVPDLKPADYVVVATAITPRVDPGGHYQSSFPVTVNLRKTSEAFLDCLLFFQAD